MEEKRFEGFIFDMDGTLLDTLPDLADVINKALKQEGLPSRTVGEVRSFVGDGALMLVKRAVPQGTGDDQIARVDAAFRSLYAESGSALTREFDGMTEALRELKARGKKLGIMSNKFEAGVKDVEARFFPGLFDASHGESPQVPRKPDPAGLLLCAQEMGLDPNQCVFVGDSAGDMKAAHAAGMFAIGATWGYQPLKKLTSESPDALIADPEDILDFA